MLEYRELPQDIRDSFAEVMKPGEELKITFGTQGRVVLNESSVGKSQNRLEPHQIGLIRSLLEEANHSRGDIQLTDKGTFKNPQLEITAISKDEAGKASSRTLLRQERDLTVSVHPADLELPQPATPSFQQSLIDTFGASPDEADKVARQHDFLVEEIKDSVIAPDPITSTVQRFSRVLSQTNIHPAAQDSIVAHARNTYESVYLKEAAEAQRSQYEFLVEEVQDENELPQPEASIVSSAPTITDARPARSPAPYRIPREAIPPHNIFTPGAANTLQALERSVNKLPESKTKALWQRVSADFSAIGNHAKRLGKAVFEVPGAVKADASTLIDQGKQQASRLGRSIDNRIHQAIRADIKGAIAAAGSRQLGKVGRYLPSRGEEAKDYGMAKAALKTYQKGHSRTGESRFSAGNYSVEALDDSYVVRNAKEQVIMTFGADSKGRPTGVTKTAAATPEDNKALNQISKADVIKGSPAAEKEYESRARAIALNAQASLEEKGKAINGRHYFIHKTKDGTLEVLTQTMAERSLEMKPDGSIKSNFTQAELKHSEALIESARQATEQSVKPREQMTV